MATPDRPWGRIRVREDQAHLLYRLLWEERGRVTRIRSQWYDVIDSKTSFNQATALVDATKDELGRLADEQGWTLHGQPEQPDQTRADPPGTDAR